MTIVTPKNIQEGRLRWVLPIIHKEERLQDVLKVSPYGKKTLKCWLQLYREDGIVVLIK